VSPGVFDGVGVNEGVTLIVGVGVGVLVGDGVTDTVGVGEGHGTSLAHSVQLKKSGVVNVAIPTPVVPVELYE
jgi:hypothetical protein